MDGQLCEYTESQWTIYFTRVNCIIRELYLNKAVKNTKQIQRSYIKLLKSQNCYGSTTEPGGVLLFFLIPKSQDFDSGHLTHLWIFPPQQEERGECLCACAALVKGWVLTMQRAEQSGLFGYLCQSTMESQTAMTVISSTMSRLRYEGIMGFILLINLALWKNSFWGCSLATVFSYFQY